jgi:uncharacterized protein
MNALVIDTFEFCRTNSSQQGVTPVAEMTRLAKECADLRRDYLESSRKHPQTGLPADDLSVNGTVQLVCQRCLQPYAHHLDSSTVLMLGKDDEDADEIEERLTTNRSM